jgi:hypothetical protein
LPQAHLSRLEVAPSLKGRDQLFVVHVAVAEVPSDRGAADAFAVGQHVFVLVVPGHGAVGK